jgi:hypothetical protein
MQYPWAARSEATAAITRGGGGADAVDVVVVPGRVGVVVVEEVEDPDREFPWVTEPAAPPPDATSKV